MGKLSVEGTKILMDNKPFYWQGLMFPNALYNSTFNKSDEDRYRWLEHFKSWGITALRVYAEWCPPAIPIGPHKAFVDQTPESSLWVYPGIEGVRFIYEPESALKKDILNRLKKLIISADELGMAIEVVLFHWLVYPVRTRDEFLELITKELKPFRNVIFQIWSEYDDHVLRHYETIKSIDPDRLVTNAPGGAGVLGSPKENSVLDLLTPHTDRSDRFWEIAPKQVKMLIETYHKPVIDDEPARTGTRFGGGNPNSKIEQHITHIDAVKKIGGYHNYHHDMFQGKYGDPTIPPSGIPEPEFSPFHRAIFEHLRSLYKSYESCQA